MSWFKQWFDELYPVVYSSRDRRNADFEVRFIAAQLPEIAKFSCLDLGCGDGRHLPGFGDIASCVVGVDYSPSLLAIAKASIAGRGNISLARADFRDLPFHHGSFDLITSLFTGFGYLDSDDEHLRLLQEWRLVLKPGGNFVLDFLDREFVLANIVPRSEREESGFRIIERRALSSDRLRIDKELEVVSTSTGEVRSYFESVRAYSSEELGQLLNKAGFTINKIFSDYTGTPYRSGLARLIIFAKRN